MFDPRLLNNEYPCHAAAYVENGEHTWTMSRGKAADGHWIKGIATHAENGLYVWFIDADGQWYKVCHSEQLRCFERYHLPNVEESE